MFDCESVNIRTIQFRVPLRLYRGNKPVLLIADPTVIKRIMVEHFHLFRNRGVHFQRRWQQAALLFASGDHWRRIRTILTPMFTSAKLKRMEPQMGQCVDALVDAMERRVKESKEEKATVLVSNESILSI